MMRCVEKLDAFFFFVNGNGDEGEGREEDEKGIRKVKCEVMLRSKERKEEKEME